MNVKSISAALNCLIRNVALTFVNDTSGTAHVYKNHRSMILKFG